jgi:hypothetical protein
MYLLAGATGETPGDLLPVTAAVSLHRIDENSILLREFTTENISSTNNWKKKCVGRWYFPVPLQSSDT